MEDKSFSEWLRSVGVITHFGVITSDSSSMLACNRTAHKVGAVTNNWNNVSCRQCLRIRSRWNVNPELANQFQAEVARVR